MGFVEKRSGRYRARYRDPLGRQRSQTFTRKADAERFIREQQVEVDRPAGPSTPAPPKRTPCAPNTPPTSPLRSGPLCAEPARAPNARPARAWPHPNPSSRRPSSDVVCSRPTKNWFVSNRPPEPSTIPSSPPPPPRSPPPGIAVLSPNGPPRHPASAGRTGAGAQREAAASRTAEHDATNAWIALAEPRRRQLTDEIRRLEDTARTLPGQPRRDRHAEHDPSLEPLIRALLVGSGRHTQQPLDLGRSLPSLAAIERHPRTSPSSCNQSVPQRTVRRQR